MLKSGKPWLLCGALLAGLGVITGAYGAHGLEKHLTTVSLQQAATGSDPALDVPRLMANYETAARYQMYHALALLAVGLLATLRPSRVWAVAALCFLLGDLLFSGGLYALVFTQEKTWAHVVPFGGLILIVGWLALAVGIKLNTFPGTSATPKL